MKLPQLQSHLKKEKLSYLLLTQDDPNFTYFTGLKNLSFSLLAIPQKGKPLLFASSLDLEKKSNLAKTLEIKKSFDKFLKKHLKKPKALACNSSNLTMTRYQKFQKIFPHTKFKDTSRFLNQLRTEKTDEEIKNLRTAAQLTVNAFQSIIKNFKTFKTENDIKFFLEKFALDHNTELSFPPIIASGKNSSHPHHATSNKTLSKGFLLIDMGISYNNYNSDMTRMLYLGKPSKKELELYNILLNVQEISIKNLKLNEKASNLDKQARKSLGKYSSYFMHSLGHGVGIEIHEFPSLSPDSKDTLKKNQTFTIEPGIYFKDFGLRIEDTILMKDRPEILTKVSKKLVIID